MTIGGGPPSFVHPGWNRAEPISDDPPVRLLHYPDGVVRVEHRCDRGPVGVIICAPALRLGDGHTITAGENGSTVTPSILCPDCGLHGFATDGRWVA